MQRLSGLEHGRRDSRSETMEICLIGRICANAAHAHILVAKAPLDTQAMNPTIPLDYEHETFNIPEWMSLCTFGTFARYACMVFVRREHRCGRYMGDIKTCGADLGGDTLDGRGEGER